VDSVAASYHYLSLRAYARVIGSNGACAGLFTYLPPTTGSTAAVPNNPASDPTVQEADIEILTSGPRTKVQYTNQPSVDTSGNAMEQATSNSTIPGGALWSSWNLYRMDWTPTRTIWWVNNVKVASISFQVPRDPASVILNMWSDGGSWTSTMAPYEYAYFQIQYLDLVFNSSTSTSKRDLGKDGGDVGSSDDTGVFGKLTRRTDEVKGCKVVCGVDEGTAAMTVGTPVLLYNSTATATLTASCGSWHSLLGWMVLGWIGAMGIGLF